MHAAGLAAVEAAKMDGRWDRAYAGPATIDVALALNTSPAARILCEGLNKTDRHAVLWRIQTVSPKARTKRIEVLVSDLAAGKSSRTRRTPSQLYDQAPIDQEAVSKRTLASPEEAPQKRARKGHVVHYTKRRSTRVAESSIKT